MMADHSPPVPSPRDTLSRLAREAVGLVPGGGGAAKALIELVLPSALESRRQEWREQVGQALERLQSRGGLNTEALARDEGFIDILVHATVAALRTRHLEKRRALSSTVAHAAIAVRADRDEELLLVRYVDELSPSHLEVLRYLVSHEASLRDAESYQGMLEGYQEHLVTKHAQVVAAEFFRLMCGDLIARGLLRVSRNVEEFPGVRDNDVIVEDEGGRDMPTVLVTELGHRLSRYVEAPD